MCSFDKEIKKKTQFTGYKVAVKRNGKYYSPITGIEYKPGLVKNPGILKDVDVGFEFVNVTNPYNPFYNEDYIGMTAVFSSKEAAKYLYDILCEPDRQIGELSEGELVFLKMTVQKTETKNCWSGRYTVVPRSVNEVYIGPKIRSCKEISF